MSTFTARLHRSLERWLDRLVTPDTRYVCGGCDDRFQTRSAGVEHILRCHPEYRGVIVYERPDDLFAPTPAGRPARTNRSPQPARWSGDLRPTVPLPALAYRGRTDM